MSGSNPPSWRTTPKKVADQAARPLRAAEKRSLRVRLLGGLVVFLTTLYCGPKRRTGNGRGREGAGLYTELAVLGVSEGVSPGLISRVGRMTALLPSFERARNELAEDGVDLDIKEVHRISTQLGAEILTTRRRDLERYRSGQMPVGKELRGKRVGVAIDGGRVRIRKLVRKQKGKGKTKTRRRKMSTEWREPKLLIIFETDAKGRQMPGTKPLIEATLEGPDGCLELLAMHLHRLGAAKAKSVTFLADGATWIWERLEWVVKRVGLDPKRVMKVLDCCHAVHQMSLALKGLNLVKSKHDKLYWEMRMKLKKSRALEVTYELSLLAEAEGLPPKSEVWTNIRYLESHAASGHMQYLTFRRRGLPLGSGAIESAIRRVVNLRLKGNGITWYAENAEGMMALRAAALTDRWKETLRHARETMSRDRCLGWEWKSPDMPAELKAGVEIKPPKPQRVAGNGSKSLAA
jgi:hypothetical protein